MCLRLIYLDGVCFPWHEKSPVLAVHGGVYGVDAPLHLHLGALDRAACRVRHDAFDSCVKCSCSEARCQRVQNGHLFLDRLLSSGVAVVSALLTHVDSLQVGDECLTVVLPQPGQLAVRRVFAARQLQR